MASRTTYTFTERDARRIVAAVRYYERTHRTGGKPRRRKPSMTAGKLAKTDAAIAVDASGVCSIYSGTQGSEADTGENITAFNKFAAIGAGKWVWLAHNGAGWYLVAARC